MKRFLAFLVPLALVACQDLPEPTALPVDAPQALQAPSSSAIPGQYIVVFRDNVADVPGLARGLVQAHGGSHRFTYQHAIRGFSAQLSDAAVKALRNNPNVAYVEQDREVHTMTTQPNATWGLDRTDQRNLPLDGSYTYNQSGTGVNAYILDTGILLTHTEFAGRLIGGFDAITPGGTANDCNGHGTHVAGTVGGTTWGIAKNVKLSPVRVLNCGGSGTYDQVIAGVDWVTANHVKPAVANMSLGGSVFAPLDNAIRASINAGVTYVVAAGNSYGANACNYSPSGVREALTVGATTRTDARAVFSNAGECIDLFAPGAGITSAWYTSPTATAVLDGTSMASPHVAGVAALYLEANPGASATQVFDAIRAGTTKGIVTNANSAKNDLLYSLFITSGPPPQEFTLTATGSRQGNVKIVDLAWAGARSTDVDIFRDKVLIATTANDGAHTDDTAPRGRGTHTYRVCEAGTKVCSNMATVTF